MNRLQSIFVAASLLLCGAALAQGPSATATLTVDKSVVTAGSTVTGKISLTFPEGYHGYQNPPVGEFEIPVKVDLAKTSKFTLVKVNYPKGKPMTLQGETKATAVYLDTIQIPVTFKAPTKPGPGSIELSLNYQECNASTCLPPDTLNLVAKVTVKAAVKKTAKPKKQ